MDCKQIHRPTDWLTHRQADEHKKVKICKNQHCPLSMVVPQIQISVLSTRYGECHSKGLIVANSYKIKQTINIITIRISTNITYICQFQFSFWSNKKNHTNVKKVRHTLEFLLVFIAGLEKELLIKETIEVSL